MYTGLLPPNSSTVGVRVAAAAVATIFPTRSLPVKKIKPHSNLSRAVASGIAPLTTVTTWVVQQGGRIGLASLGLC